MIILNGETIKKNTFFGHRWGNRGVFFCIFPDDFSYCGKSILSLCRDKRAFDIVHLQFILQFFMMKPKGRIGRIVEEAYAQDSSHREPLPLQKLNPRSPRTMSSCLSFPLLFFCDNLSSRLLIVRRIKLQHVCHQLTNQLRGLHNVDNLSSRTRS